MSLLESLNAGSAAISPLVLVHLAQATLLAGILLLLDQTIGRRLGPGWRSALWLLLFVKLLLPPQLSVPLSPWYWLPTASNAEADPVRATEPQASAWANEATIAESATIAETLHAGAPLGNPDETAVVRPTVATGLLLLSACFTLYLLAAGFRRHRRLCQVLADGTPASPPLDRLLQSAKTRLGMKREVSLWIHQEPIRPLVTGLAHPSIHLSQDLVERLDEAALEAALLHELYHLCRGDLWLSIVQFLLQAFFPYHPVLWWVRPHWSRLREQAIDEAVLSHPDISPRTYCRALVEAAALSTASTPPTFSALGVINQPTQLTKRIKMNLQSPHRRASLRGLPAFASIVLLGLILVPMMPGIPTPQSLAVNQPPSSAYHSVGAAPLCEKIDATTDRIIGIFNRRDREAYLDAFTDDALILANGAPLIRGRSGVAEMYLQSPDTMRYLPFESRVRKLAECGNWVIETTFVDFQFQLAPEAPVLHDPRQCLTIWEDTGGPFLKVKLLSWNALFEPRRLGDSIAPTAFQRSGEPAALSDEDRAQLQRIEADFHACFNEQDYAAAAEYYAPEAMLIPPGALPLTGRSAINAYLDALPPAQRATAVEQSVAAIDGNEDLALVVNLFRWKFRPVPEGPEMIVTGKGVHLWERTSEGSWHLLYDLPNASQR